MRRGLGAVAAVLAGLVAGCAWLAGVSGETQVVDTTEGGLDLGDARTGKDASSDGSKEADASADGRAPTDSGAGADAGGGASADATPE